MKKEALENVLGKGEIIGDPKVHNKLSKLTAIHLPDFLGSSNSEANKDMMSKIE